MILDNFRSSSEDFFMIELTAEDFHVAHYAPRGVDENRVFSVRWGWWWVQILWGSRMSEGGVFPNIVSIGRRISGS